MGCPTTRSSRWWIAIFNMSTTHVDIRIGKIKSIRFGHGGYDDAMIGVTFDLGSETGWGVGDFWGTWFAERSGREQWSEADRIRKLGEVAMRINALLVAAKVHDLADLKGKPIEATIEGHALKSWRVLAEAI